MFRNDHELSDVTDDDGNLMTTMPGGYPIIYFDHDNSILCAECANQAYHDPDELPAFRPVDYMVHYEGEPEQCEQCGLEIESAYGGK